MKKIAKYEIIYQDLKKKIIEGSFHDGKLPPVSELTSMYNASLLTVNNAVKLLAEEGIVSRGTGRSGTRINQPGLRNINLNNPRANTWDDSPEIFRNRRVTLRYLTDRSAVFIPESMPLVIREFEKRYPWIHIEQDFTDSPDFISESDHDIIQASHSCMLPLINRKQLLDLTPYFKKFGRKNRCLNDDCTVPLMISMPLFFGVDKNINSLPETWQDFAELNRKLKAENKYSAVLTGFFSTLHFFIGDISKNLSSENSRADFIRLIELLRDYYKWETPWNNFSPSAVIKAVNENKISVFAAYLNSHFCKTSNEFDIAPLPNCGSYLVETVRAGISKNCRYTSEAWLFINFLRSEAVQKKLVSESYGIPYNEKIFHSDFKEKFPKIYNVAAPLLEKIHESSISDNARNMIYHVVYPLLEECFKNDISAEQCITSLQEAIEELLILDNIEQNL